MSMRDLDASQQLSTSMVVRNMYQRPNFGDILVPATLFKTETIGQLIIEVTEEI